MFFCVLFLAPSYSDFVWYDHLEGNIRYAAAKATLLRPNLWPYNDGVNFFHDLSDQDEQLLDSNSHTFSFL